MDRGPGVVLVKGVLSSELQVHAVDPAGFEPATFRLAPDALPVTLDIRPGPG